MKFILIAAAGLLLTNLSQGQDLNPTAVPSVVINKFNKAFPGANSVEWERKGEWYTADFDLKWRDHEVWLNAQGAIVKHKKEIKENELPKAVAQQIKLDYSGYRIDDIDQYEIQKQFFYKVELKKEGLESEVFYNIHGKVSTDPL